MTLRLHILAVSVGISSALVTPALVFALELVAPQVASQSLEVRAGLDGIADIVEQDGTVRTVDAVDLERYAGDWFEIARFPNRFQRQCAGDVRAAYARRPDGRIDVINRCRKNDGDTTEARGVARVVDLRTSAKLKVRFAPALLSFLPSVWGDYWVLGLADDYSWAIVGSPDRKYLWILARTPAMNADSYAAAIAVARANGFDVGRLVKTAHSATARGDTP